MRAFLKVEIQITQLEEICIFDTYNYFVINVFFIVYLKEKSQFWNYMSFKVQKHLYTCIQFK